MLTSNDPQTIIRTARKAYRCDCHASTHAHLGGKPFADTDWRWCPETIQPGDRYPEYLGEARAYESGHRFCPECRKSQLGDWISDE